MQQLTQRRQQEQSAMEETLHESDLFFTTSFSTVCPFPAMCVAGKCLLPLPLSQLLLLLPLSSTYRQTGVKN